MRLRYIVLMTAASFLLICNAESAATDDTKLTATDSRSLRVHKPAEVDSTSEDDEERGFKLFGLGGFKLFGSGVKKSDDFAKDNLNKMLVDKSFRQEMFSKWNDHSLDEIIKALSTGKRKNSRFLAMELDYLNHVRPKSVHRVSTQN